jgi:hypothetical protein
MTFCWSLLRYPLTRMRFDRSGKEIKCSLFKNNGMGKAVLFQ